VEDAAHDVIERLNEEFRRRVKTQVALPTEDAALVLLVGLVVSGQIRPPARRLAPDPGAAALAPSVGGMTFPFVPVHSSSHARPPSRRGRRRNSGSARTHSASRAADDRELHQGDAPNEDRTPPLTRNPVTARKTGEITGSKNEAASSRLTTLAQLHELAPRRDSDP
jgi:hypothetical protein